MAGRGGDLPHQPLLSTTKNAERSTSSETGRPQIILHPCCLAPSFQLSRELVKHLRQAHGVDIEALPPTDRGAQLCSEASGPSTQESVEEPTREQRQNVSPTNQARAKLQRVAETPSVGRPTTLPSVFPSIPFLQPAPWSPKGSTRHLALLVPPLPASSPRSFLRSLEQAEDANLQDDDLPLPSPIRRILADTSNGNSDPSSSLAAPSQPQYPSLTVQSSGASPRSKSAPAELGTSESARKRLSSETLAGPAPGKKRARRRGKTPPARKPVGIVVYRNTFHVLEVFLDSGLVEQFRLARKRIRPSDSLIYAGNSSSNSTLEGSNGDGKNSRSPSNLDDSDSIIIDSVITDSRGIHFHKCQFCVDYYKSKGYFQTGPEAHDQLLLLKTNRDSFISPEGRVSLSFKVMCCCKHLRAQEFVMHVSLLSPTDHTLIATGSVSFLVKQWKNKTQTVEPVPVVLGQWIPPPDALFKIPPMSEGANVATGGPLASIPLRALHGHQGHQLTMSPLLHFLDPPALVPPIEHYGHGGLVRGTNGHRESMTMDIPEDMLLSDEMMASGGGVPGAPHTTTTTTTTTTVTSLNDALPRQDHTRRM